MRIVVFDGLPFDLEAKKASAPEGTTIMGSGVFGAAMAAALLRHGTWDGYWFPGKARVDHFLNQSPDFADGKGRARIVSLHDLARCSAAEVLLVTTGPSLGNVLPFRAAISRGDLPLSGFIHSLHGRAFANCMLQAMQEDLRPSASLVCSTRAGKIAVENVMQLLAQRARLLPLDGDRKIHLPVIPLGVDCSKAEEGNRERCRAAAGIPENSVVGLYFGRFSATSKGDLCPLLHAFAKLRGCEHARLVLAGDDTQFRLSESLRSQAVGWGCGDRVHIMPNPTLAAKWDLLAAADFFVSPADNIQETFGITLAEAMAAGLPVIASDWNGYRDLVIHGTTGLLVPARWFVAADQSITEDCTIDAGALAASTIVDVEILSQHMQILIENATYRQRLGEMSRRRALQTYDWPMVIREYERLWEWQLCEARRNPCSASISGLTVLPPVQLFSHYPSGSIGDEDRVALDARPSNLDGVEAWILDLVVAQSGNDGIAIADLRAEAVRGGHARADFDVGLAKLLKGGFLRTIFSAPEPVYR